MIEDFIEQSLTPPEGDRARGLYDALLPFEKAATVFNLDEITEGDLSRVIKALDHYRNAHPNVLNSEWRCINCKEVVSGVEMPDRCGTCCCSSFAKVAAIQSLTPPECDTVSEGVVEALTPSGDTKAAYSGEFKIPLVRIDENGDEYTERVYVPWDTIKEIMAAIRNRASLQSRVSPQAPIPMLLYCPQCGQQHIDEPDERTPDWDNPPHRSHLCHDCGCIWRPADVPTNGVRAIETHGKADTWTTERGNAERAVSPQAGMREALEKCLAIACDYTLDERTARSDIANIARAAL